MAYTPIGWQTGDTITAEKLNKMDNGWGVEESATTLTEESVTTAEDDGIYVGELTYNELINADVIYVTFNGTRYECPVINLFSQKFYGGFSEQGPTFTDFPFAVSSFTPPNGSSVVNEVYTETAGTYSIKIEVAEEKTEVSDAFKEAVDLCVDVPRILRCVENVTKYEDAHDCMVNGGIVYFIATDSRDGSTRLYFITSVSTPCSILPESTKIEASFDRDSGIFSITYL